MISFYQSDTNWKYDNGTFWYPIEIYEFCLFEIIVIDDLISEENLAKIEDEKEKIKNFDLQIKKMEKAKRDQHKNMGG